MHGHHIDKRSIFALGLVSSVLPRLGTFLLLGYVGWVGWDNLGPSKPEISPIRRDLVDKVVPGVVEDIRRARGAVRETVLIHLDNDPTDYFTDALRYAIEQQGVLDLRDRPIAEKFRNMLSMREPYCQSHDAAVTRGRDAEADGVLYGTVHLLESHAHGAELDVELKLADVATGQTILSKRYTETATTGAQILAGVQEKSNLFPWFQRVVGWMLTVLLLPVFTISFMRTMLRKESNRANAFVLGTYTIADVLLAWLLVGATLNSWWTATIFMIAIGAAFAYNIHVMTFATRLEKT